MVITVLIETKSISKADISEEKVNGRILMLHVYMISITAVLYRVCSKRQAAQIRFTRE